MLPVLAGEVVETQKLVPIPGQLFDGSSYSSGRPAHDDAEDHHGRDPQADLPAQVVLVALGAVFPVCRHIRPETVQSTFVFGLVDLLLEITHRIQTRSRRTVVTGIARDIERVHGNGFTARNACCSTLRRRP